MRTALNRLGPIARLAGLAAIACGLVAGSGQAAIFGADDRVALPERLKALKRSVGLLSNDRSRTVCSAFCVADTVIATAGHCVFRTGSETPPPVGAFRFSRPALPGSPGARIAGAADGTAAMNVAAGGARLSVKPPINAPADWALLRLDSPVCAGAVLPLAKLSPEQVAQAAAQRALFLAGFHRDFANWGLAYSQPCEAGRHAVTNDWGTLLRDFVRPDQLILHTCDTAAASSGAPLLIEGARGPEVIGINVGTYVQSQVETQDGVVTHRYKADTVANTGVSTQAFAASVAAFRTAGVVADKPTLRTLQQALAERGHYEGAMNGRFSLALRAAIIAVEPSEGLPVTGVPTRALITRLNGQIGAGKGKAGEPAALAPLAGAGRGRISPGRS